MILGIMSIKLPNITFKTELINGIISKCKYEIKLWRYTEMDSKFKKQIENVVKLDDRIWNNDFKVINKNILFKLIDDYDQGLIEALFNEKEIRDFFFQQVGNSYIFKNKEFKFYIEENKVFNTFTNYSNKIGLSLNDDFLSNSDKTVLNFPFKDCVLEGGQSSDDGYDKYFEIKEVNDSVIVNELKSKREEIFFNEVLGRDEIDRLFERKAFKNWKRFNNEGSFDLTEIKRDSQGKIIENLVIKGNNLLALHSIKEQFNNSLKMIYIDVPYNTGSDSFAYNDRFSTSTWLTFMKNRLEVSFEMLNEEGLFFIHTSYHMYAHLKVLCDELFINYITTLNVLVRHPNRILKGDKDFHDVIEYILIYSKNSKKGKLSRIKEKNDIKKYMYTIKENSEGNVVQLDGGKTITYFLPNEYSEEKLGIAAKDAFQKISIRGSLKEGNSSGRFYCKYLETFNGKYPPGTLFKVNGIGDDIYDHRYFYLPNEGKQNGGYYQGVPRNYEEYKYKPYPNFIDMVKEYNSVGYEGGVSLRNGKKPEDLITYLFEIAGVKKNDKVLDFFFGSGTTGAVAHKMGIQYIGIEQMDYIEEVAVERLKNVVAGESGGISKGIKWQGGGEFVYFELAEWNLEAKTKIEKCKSFNSLKKEFNEIYENYYLKYNVKINDFKNSLISDTKFLSLDLDIQKEMFKSMLDLNHLYIHFDEIDDSKFKISEYDAKFTKLFYMDDENDN